MELSNQPFSLLKNFNYEINRLFNQQAFPATGAISAFHPEIDIEETAKEYVVTANVPGVETKNVEVFLNQGVLTIKGKTTTETHQKQKNYICIERGTGIFTRSIALPNVITNAKITAQHKNGVLTLRVPKTTGTNRKIQIKH